MLCNILQILLCCAILYEFHHVLQLFLNFPILLTELCWCGNALWYCCTIVCEFHHIFQLDICEFHVVQFFLNFTMLCNYCWISSHCAIISECHHTTHRVMLMWVFLLLLSSIVYKIPWILPCCANILNFTMLCNCLWFLMYVHTDGWMTDGRSEWWTVKSWCLRIFRS